MGYYSDLFLRPKQATASAYDNPSVIRGIGFVILGVLVALVSGLAFSSALNVENAASVLLNDLIFLIIDALVLLIIGVLIHKATFSPHSFAT